MGRLSTCRVGEMGIIGVGGMGVGEMAIPRFDRPTPGPIYLARMFHRSGGRMASGVKAAECCIN